MFFGLHKMKMSHYLLSLYTLWNLGPPLPPPFWTWSKDLPFLIWKASLSVTPKDKIVNSKNFDEQKSYELSEADDSEVRVALPSNLKAG